MSATVLQASMQRGRGLQRLLQLGGSTRPTPERSPSRPPMLPPPHRDRDRLRPHARADPSRMTGATFDTPASTNQQVTMAAAAAYRRTAPSAESGQRAAVRPR